MTKNITEKQVEELLKTLPKKQLIQFGISCVERNIGLYKTMEEKIGKLPKSKSYEALVAIVDFIKNDIYSADKTKIKGELKKCDRIADYLDEELDDFTMVCLVGMISSILSFYLSEEVEDIIVCMADSLEIINQLKSDEYTKTVNPDADDNELSEYLTSYFNEELQLEYDTIMQLKKNTPKEEAQPLQPNKPKRNTAREKSSIKKMAAKNFKLQLNPESNILKIGFGMYFYANAGQIKMSDEFTVVNLSKIENLQIDENKRTVEFDSVFKKVQTHFIVKEAYKGTLEIMKFISMYNEKPFKLNPKYKDDVGIEIDKDGYNISLSRPGCEKSIYLYSTKKGNFFQIYFPEPIKRFGMKSYNIDQNGLGIQHDDIDLSSNETTNSTGYSWSFDIQPEIKELMIRFIEVGMNTDMFGKK